MRKNRGSFKGVKCFVLRCTVTALRSPLLFYSLFNINQFWSVLPKKSNSCCMDKGSSAFHFYVVCIKVYQGGEQRERK